MTQAELYTLLKSIKIPIAERVFEKPQKPPYGIYYRINNDSTYADNCNYAESPRFVFELYTAKRNLELEQKIEELFKENDMPYSVNEIYISEEKLREVIYEFNI